MSHLADAFYQQDRVRVMAEVTVALATAIGSNVVVQQAALDAAEDALAALLAAGENPPADMAAKTDEYVQGVRDSYQEAKDAADELLALPPDVQAALGVNVERETLKSEQAQQWLTAIDAAWTPPGGGG